jgi:hypothetical protein
MNDASLHQRNRQVRGTVWRKALLTEEIGHIRIRVFPAGMLCFFVATDYALPITKKIDIVLSGDLDAARSVTHVEIPSVAGGYRAFYNPGGPGPEPFDEIRYAEPGPADLEPVIIAIDDPMRVSRSPQQ